MEAIQWLSNGANIIRLLKITIGTSLVIVAFFEKNAAYGMLGGIVLLQGILNTCCGSGGCNINPTDQKKETNEITYEEVK